MSYMTDEELRKKYKAVIESFTLFDDFFMSIVLKDNKELMAHILQIVLNKPGLQVTRVTTQDNENNLFGRSARFDILAVDKKGVLYHIEVQNSEDDADEHRAGFYSAVIVEKSTDRGKKKVTYPENYTIFLTRTDYFKEGKATYLVDRYYGEEKKPFKDDIHIIYINGSYKDYTTNIGQLIHDFHCTDPEQMFHTLIADGVRKYKNEEGGQKEVCEQIQKIEDEGRREGRREGRLEGKREGRREGKREGRREGRREGKEEARKEIALGMLTEGIKIETIASVLKEPVEVIKSWLSPVKS